MNKNLKSIVDKEVTKHLKNKNQLNENDLLNETFRILTETYVFDDEDDDVIDTDMETEEDDIYIGQDENSEEGLSNNIKSVVSDIRKKILTLMSDDSVVSNPEMYKSIKSIWDICDKMLINKQK